jgi:CRISPR system Cascade subunit CasA
MIAPWEIGASDNPVMELCAPRPDFRGALYQFLIGLVQTAYMPEDDDDWKDKWDTIPSCSELKKAFEQYASAFELYNESGPAFMQDFDLPEKNTESNIQTLLIDFPGENTVKLNKDFFIKRTSANEGLCESCAALSLFTLQLNAPAGGQGNRTSLRGGGPLTTLVMPDSQAVLWQVIWLNIMPEEDSDFEAMSAADEKLFPWLGKTHDSSDNSLVYPKQVNLLQQFWGMPRRIRLNELQEEGICSICGRKSKLCISYHSKNYGNNYSLTWQHVLSPYQMIVDKKTKAVFLKSLKGERASFIYTNWLSLALFDSFDRQNNEMAAIVQSYTNSKYYLLKDTPCSLWCFGYDMDNMKAKCWYEHKLPIQNIPGDKRDIYITTVQKMIVAAKDCSKLLSDEVKEAWFRHPKEHTAVLASVVSTFFSETENEFFIQVDKLMKAVVSGSSKVEILKDWQQFIIVKTEAIFDLFAFEDMDDAVNMRRISLAASTLSNILHSGKMKSFQALLEEE